VDQPLEVVGLDGVPTGSQDGTARGRPIWMKHILIPTGGRAEFIVTTPQASVKRAAFETRAIDTGPDGDSDTARALALLTVTGKGSDAGADLPSMPPARPAPSAQLFGGLEGAQVTASRTLYFSSFSKAPRGRLHHDHATKFFITVDGQRPRLFRTDNPPAIVTTQGAVEEWTVENRTGEVHEFHMHQIHFKLMKQNGVVLRPSQRQYLDTVQVPYWTGTGPYPSVTMLMDFRGHVTGDFVYHCHILEHEDGGMMATIRVLPRP
ncbi:MAG: multicopper oxidase domain-containing protein, partial [Caulobacteraceae bacterium]|nr:multicopper oxidase domain-containing protein [Caulobacteraceae bacterium]